jgi:PKD repeat protein
MLDIFLTIINYLFISKYIFLLKNIIKMKQPYKHILQLFLIIFGLLWAATEGVAQVNRCDLPVSADCDNVTANGGLPAGVNYIFCKKEAVRIVNNSIGAIDSTYICWGNGRDTALVGRQGASHLYQIDTNSCNQFNFIIRMTVIKRCPPFQSSHYIETPIVIRNPPKARFTPESSICQNRATTFNNSSCPGRYVWDFGDGSPLDSTNWRPSHVYREDGNYVVKLKVFGCDSLSDSLTRTIEVIKEPKAFATILNGNGGGNNIECKGFTAQFNNLSRGAQRYSWSAINLDNPLDTVSPRTSVFSNPTFTFHKAGRYQVRLIAASDNCGSATWDTILTVLEKPIIDLPNVTDGCERKTLNFNNVRYTGGTPLSYHWTFSGITPDSSAQRIPNDLTYPIGNYTVIARATNLCGTGSDTIHFRVNSPPTPQATYTQNPASGCVPLDVRFQNQTFFADSNGYTWRVLGIGRYELREGTTLNSTNPIFRLSDAGTYRIQMDARGCTTRSWDTTVTVLDSIKVSFDSIPNGCLSLELNPSSYVRYLGSTPTRYEWSFLGGVTPSSDTTQTPPTIRYTNRQQYSIVLAVSNVCGVARDTVSFLVDTVPTVRARGVASNANSCTPVDIQFFNELQYVQQYAWGVRGVGRFNFENSSNTSPNPTLRFLDEGTYTISLTGVGCVRETWDTTISVTSIPSVNLDSYRLSNPCLPYNLNIGQFTRYSGGVPTRYEWLFMNSPTDTLRRDTISAPPSITFNSFGEKKVIVKIDNRCGESRDTIVFNLKGSPTLNPVVTFSDTNKCITPNTALSVFINTENKTFTDSIRIQAVGAQIVREATGFRLTYLARGNYSVRLTAIGCTEIVWDTTFAVETPPSVSLASVSDTCQSMSINPATIVRYSEGVPTLYRWTFSNYTPDSSSAAFPAILNYTNAGNYNIHIRVQNICGVDTAQIAFRINDPSPISISPQPIICNTISTITLRATPEGGTWVGNAVTQAGIFSPPTAAIGANRLVYRYGSGRCFSSDTTLVIVSGTIVEAGSDTAGCENGAALQLQGFSPLNGTWRGIGITDSLNGTFNPQSVGAGIYTVTYVYRNSDGCTNTDTRRVTVNSAPNAAFDSLALGCIHVPINFNNQSSNINTVHWNFGDNNISNELSPTHTYNATGQYEVRLQVRTLNGCVDSTRRTVEIYRVGTAEFTPSTHVGCGEILSIDFANRSSGSRLSYNWTFGNGQTSILQHPPTINFRQSIRDTVYFITLAARNHCGTVTKTDTILVRPRPKSIFGMQSDVICSPMRVTFGNTSTGVPDTYRWIFNNGNTSSDSIPIVQIFRTDTLPRTYQVSLITQNGCGSDTLTQPLTVQPPNVRAFFTLNETLGCAPFDIAAINFATLGSRVWWTTNEGGTSSAQDTFRYQFREAGEYVITQYATNGCGYDSTQLRVIVQPRPIVGFTHVPMVCQGEPIHFTDTSSNFVLSTWSFGNGDSSRLRNPTYRYASAGNYTVSLTGRTITEGCPVIITSPVVVRPLPVPRFSINATSGCRPFTVSFNNQSIRNVYNAWEFGDGGGSIEVNPSYTYDTVGTFNVRLRLSDDFGCRADTLFQRIVVYPTPDADFEIQRDKICGLPVNARFSNRSLGAIAYHWDFNNSITSQNPNPTSIFSVDTTYQIRLIAITGFNCRDTIVKNMRANAQPNADFEISPQRGCEPLQVKLTDKSTNANGLRRWTFNDGTTWEGREREFFHIYDRAGVYSPSMIVDNAGVCFDTVRFPSSIRVFKTPTADFSYRDSFLGDPTGIVLFTNRSLNAQSYVWNFGNFVNSTEINPTYRFLQNGESLIRLIARSTEGCSDTLEKRIKPEFFSGLFVPNAFEPFSSNPDLNRFHVKAKGLKTYRLSIRSSWGDLIFESTKLVNGEPVESWDGMFRGKMMPQDVYVWDLQATFENGAVWLGMPDKNGNFRNFGTITIIR